MDSAHSILARAARPALALVAAITIAACNLLGAPSPGPQPTLKVGNVPPGTGQPAYPGPATQTQPTATVMPPSPVPAPALGPIDIFIDSPAPGTLVGSPAVIVGRTSRLPLNGILNYRVVDGAGQQLGANNFSVSGAPGQPGSFNAPITFTLPRDGGPVRLELSERGAAGAPTTVSTLDMVVDAQYQGIVIDSPSDGTPVGSPMTFTGRTVRGPHGGGLGYSIYNSAGRQIGGDAFPVFDNPGGQRSFAAELRFDYPFDGDTLHVDIYDWNPTTGRPDAVASRSVVALPVPLQISLDTPPGGTLVGSPFTLTGQTNRYPINGDLGYRITNDAGQRLGDGTFRVNGAPGQGASFNVGLTFQILRDGGTIHLNVFDQDPSNGAEIANMQLDLDVLAQYQGIQIGTPAAGTQVGSPVVITGRINQYPPGGQMQYRVLSGGQQIGSGTVAVDGAPGQRGSFTASLTFTEPPNGGNIRVELSVPGASTGIDLVVVPPPPQQIIIDTPPAGTQVGSPVVITGRTTRRPDGGRLNYIVRDAAGAVIGSGQFGVVPDSAGSPTTSFTAALTFAEPSGGGNISVEIYAPSPVSSGIARSSIGLYVAPRP